VSSLARAAAAAVLVAVVAVPSAAGARNGVRGAGHRESAHVAVIGGQPAAPGTFPWMAYVLDVRGTSVGQCSGTVVAPNLILTAGHCAENEQTGVVNEASGYRVMTGNLNSAAPETESQVSAVTRVIICSCHDRHTAVGDVALLQLSTPTTAPTITLASRPAGNAPAILAGWGVTSFAQQSLVEQLQWAPTRLEPAAACEREAPPFSPASEICTMGSPASTGVCSGDSGGPLLEPMPSAVGGMVQIGVTSHGYRQCATTRPSVFTRVDAISSWIKQWTQALAPGSTLTSSETVPSPSLAGIATGRSLRIRRGYVSLVIACDGEGGVCTGDAEATIVVRERRIVRSDGRLSVSPTRTLRATLAKVVFAIAPGASTVVSSELSPQNRTLLSRLDGPLDVLLSGRGITSHVVTLEPTGRG
jgi:Trypsin